MLNSQKNRGVRDILIICADDLTEIEEVISAAFPQTEYQCCIVYQLRNILKFVEDKDRKLFAVDLKKLCHAPNAEYVAEVKDSVMRKWNPKYPNAMKFWVVNWDAITSVFKCSADVRTIIYIPMRLKV